MPIPDDTGSPMSDDYSLDSVLFGGDDPPGDGSFDPFLPGLGEADGTNDDLYGDTDHSGESNSSVGVIRYGRFGGESDNGYEPDDDGPLLRTGGPDNTVFGSEEHRARAATDTGIGHLRRVADERSGSTREGEPGTHKGVASSIAAAQQRIRESAIQPITDSERRDIAVASGSFTHGSNKPKREYQKRTVTEVPTFQECEFIATIAGLKTNVTGTWTLTLNISPSESAEALKLKDSFGLALTVHAYRKQYTVDGDS
jgi:hypothetical protein